MDEYVIAPKSSIVSIADAIRTKTGGIDGYSIEGIVSEITNMKNVDVRQGSVTFSENTVSYTFVDDSPNIFILYCESEDKKIYNSSQYIWCMFQDNRIFNYGNRQVKTSFIFGYNNGIYNYYAPYKTYYNTIGSFHNSNFNGYLGAGVTYHWYAIYGIDAE